MVASEEQRKHDSDIMLIYISVVIGLVIVYLFGYAGSIMENERLSYLSAVLQALERASHMEFLYYINSTAIKGMVMGVFVSVFVFFLLRVDADKNAHYKLDEVAGSGRFMSSKEMKEFVKKYAAPEPKDKTHASENMILSKRMKRLLDAKKISGSNSNVLIVGSAGSGKSFGVIKPNLAQANCSFVITDPSGEVLHDMGNLLLKRGYKIKVFNLADMKHSNCYNPLRYVRNETGIRTMVEIFIKNTSVEGSKSDEFWVKSEMLLYTACVSYLLYHCNDESRKNFSSIYNMVNAAMVDENNASYQSPLDTLFNSLPKSSIAWKNYSGFKKGTGKTLKSILITCITRLQPFITEDVANLTKTDNLELEKFCDEKTALFIITPQADHSYSFLAAMLFSQLFETLYYKGDMQEAQKGTAALPIPVRCLMDEFANIGEVPEFPSKLATMRKYNISVDIVLQDMSQLEAMYKDDWRTLVGNCYTRLFLGSSELKTLQYFSDMLGKKTVRNRGNSRSRGRHGSASNSFQQTGREVLSVDELGRLPSDECIVFTTGHYAARDKKYKLSEHPNFGETAIADPNNAFNYKELAAFDNTKPKNLSSILKARDEAARIRKFDPEQAVTDPIKTSDVSMNGSPNELLNRIVLDREIEEPVYQEIRNNCLEMAAGRFNDPVCFVKIDNIPSRVLPRLVQETSAALGKSPMIIFTDMHSSDNVMVGIGIDVANEGLYANLKNEYLKDIKKVGAFTLIIINRNMYDNYRKTVLASFSNQTETSQPARSSKKIVLSPRKKEPAKDAVEKSERVVSNGEIEK